MIYFLCRYNINMKYSNGQNVTSINTILPELEDIDDSYSGLENNTRCIRNHTKVIPSLSGMNPQLDQRYKPEVVPSLSGMNPQLEQRYKPEIIENQTTEMYYTPFHHPHEKEEIKKFHMPIGTPSCLDVAEHIANCPLCSKFYSTDKTIYIVAIVALSIICILLLKKVLDL